MKNIKKVIFIQYFIKYGNILLNINDIYIYKYIYVFLSEFSFNTLPKQGIFYKFYQKNRKNTFFKERYKGLM